MKRHYDRFEDVWEYFASKRDDVEDQRLLEFRDVIETIVYRKRKDYSPSEVDAVTQEAYIKLMVMAADGAINKDFRSATYFAVLGAIRDFERKREENAIESFTDYSEKVSGFGHESAEDHAFLVAIMDEVVRKMDELSPRDREIIRLIYIEGHKQIEVAEILGIEKKQMSEYHSRAVKRLRKLFKEHQDYSQFIMSRQVAKQKQTPKIEY